MLNQAYMKISRKVYFCIIFEDACIYEYCNYIFVIYVLKYINVDLSNLVRTTRLWNNHHVSGTFKIERLETQ